MKTQHFHLLTASVVLWLVDMLALSAEDFGLEPRSVQTNDYKIKIGFCCFPAKHTALRRQSKNLLALNPTDCYFSELHVTQ